MSIAAVKTVPFSHMLSKAFFDKVFLFRDLSDEGLHELDSIAEPRSFRKNEVVFPPQNLERSIFFVKEGSVKLGMRDRNGKEVILYILREGDFFGEASLFDCGSQLIIATALEPCQTLMLCRRPFMDFVGKHPEVLVRMLSTLSLRLREAEQRIRSLVFADAYEKVASALMDALEGMKVPLHAGVEVPLSLTRRELAGLVGVSRETFTRVMTAFQKAGLLCVKQRRIAVVNPTKLKREATRSWRV